MIGREINKVNGVWGCKDDMLTNFERAEIVDFGKWFRYNDFVTRYVVRLSNEQVLFINASAESETDRKWFRKLAKKVEYVRVDRYSFEAISWRGGIE